MSFTPQQLYTEFSTDSSGVGYATALATGGIATLASLINAVGAGSSYLITLLGIQRQALIFGAALQIQEEINTGIGADGVTALTAAVKEEWSAIIEEINASDPGEFIPFSVFGARNPIGDNVLTAAQATATTTRQGSRAEVLWGPGTVIQWSDVDAALTAK